MIETITNKNCTLAIIVRDNYISEGIEFLTPNEYSQQLAYMHHPVGKKIDAHIHNEVHRSILNTQEVLVIKRGILRVDFYDNQQQYIGSKRLYQGDIILLVSGGHGFEVEEEVIMIEVKQGPYSGSADKVRFEATDSDTIRYL